MDDGKTVLMRPVSAPPSTGGTAVHVTYATPDGAARTVRFATTFRVGRDAGCGLRIADDGISRQHAEVYRGEGGWRVRDLGSTNGSVLNGSTIDDAPLGDNATLELGFGGPRLMLAIRDASQDDLTRTTGAHVAAPPLAATASAAAPGMADTRAPTTRSVDDIVDRYLSDKPSGPVGEHTMMVRRAFQIAKKRQSRRYHFWIAGIGVLLVGALAAAIYEHNRVQRVRSLAVDIFYDMKAIELQVSQIEAVIGEATERAQLQALASKKDQLRSMQDRYRNFLEETSIFGRKLSKEDQLIAYVARIFGECELNIPSDFRAEVKSYIQKWKGSPRLANAIARMKKNNYGPRVYAALREQQLQPQFLYLALQESDFKHDAVGPATRFGFAKGIWQFIPDTGTRYGLRPGPLADRPFYDPLDERFNFDKATRAAASYLRDIYNGEAQASGLLVIASYNWGHNRVKKLVKKLPENPRERNFWKLLERYKIPKETYDYVFYIFSAAVIGEDPALFGFEFENPLATVISPAS